MTLKIKSLHVPPFEFTMFAFIVLGIVGCGNESKSLLSNSQEPDSEEQQLQHESHLVSNLVAVASHTSGSYVASRAVDSALDTDWRSGTVTNPTLTIDRGFVASITAVNVKMNANIAYRFEISSDGSNYQVINQYYKHTDTTSQRKVLPVGLKARYLRIRYSNWNYNVRVFNISIEGGVNPTPTTAPTVSPTTAPTVSPTTAPTVSPTTNPTEVPTSAPALTSAIYVSPSGNDANSGASSSPLKTIGAAAARAKPGTVVMIGTGTYAEQVVTKVAGTATAPITFQSHNGTVTIDGSSLSWTSGGNQNQGLVELRHPYTNVVGLRVINSKNTGVLLAADNIVVDGNEVAQAQLHGISTHTGYQTGRTDSYGRNIKNVVVKNNDVHHVMLKGWGFGQAVSLIADGFVVSGNRVHDVVTEGIDIWLSAKHGEVVDNIIYNTQQVGIYIDGVSHVRIHRNKIYNSKAGIGLSSEDVNYGTSDIWVYNNLIYDNSGQGCFVWDPDQGPKNVAFFNNTLINNTKGAFYFAGSGMNIEVMNNLHFGGSLSFSDASNSTINVHDNHTLTGLTGFVNASGKDFRLTSSSTALNKGKALPVIRDDLGASFVIDTDFAKASRVVNSIIDFGAFELQ